MAVYLLHFNRKFQHARHYIGFVKDYAKLQERIQKHRNGNGSKLMAAVSKAGIKFRVARLWPAADGNFERQLKNRRKSRCLCPLCMAKEGKECGPIKSNGIIYAKTRNQ